MKYDIVYSVTAHECIQCVFNLYENIMKFNAGLKTLVLFHVNKKLYWERFLFRQRDNLWFYPNPSEKRRFTQDLFLAHLENYALVRGMHWDFFCTLASNCMFIRQTDGELIRATTPRLSASPHELERDTSINFDNIEEEWFWPIVLQCREFMELFGRHKIGFQARSHEGAYFRKEVMERIWAFSMENIVGKVELKDGMSWEELLFPSLEKYLTGELGTRYCKHFPFDREIPLEELREMAAGDDPRNMVKRVERSMDSKVRQFICTSL